MDQRENLFLVLCSKSRLRTLKFLAVDGPLLAQGRQPVEL